MKQLALVLMMIFSSFAVADPSPFGLELGKTTIDQATSLYEMEPTGTNKYTNGPMFRVPTGQVDFDGLQQLTLIFDDADVLMGVLAVLPKHRFDDLHQTLSGKYRVVATQIPFVGDAAAKYADGATEITLDAPHLSFQMSMNYIRKELSDTFAKQSADEEAAKKRSETSQL